MRRLILAMLSVLVSGLPATPGVWASGRDEASRGYVGVLYSDRACEVSSELPGVLLRYRIRPGDSVTAGQILAVLDKSSTERNLAMAEAALNAARAEEAKATVELEQARQTLERRNRVAWALSSEEIERFGAQESLAIAGVEVARAHTSEQASRCQQVRDNLSKCEVRAPFGGRVSRVYLSEGALLSLGTPIARLVASGDLWVRFAVPPEEADWIHPGVLAHVFPEDGGPTMLARIEHVPPEIDPASGMLFVEARLDLRRGAPLGVRPGTVVSVRESSP